MWRIGWAPNSIPLYLYIQQDATLHSLFISGNCSTCFGWYFHPSSGAHTTVSTASGICHTVTAICRYRGRVGTDLSVLWVAYATSSEVINSSSSEVINWSWHSGFWRKRKQTFFETTTVMTKLDHWLYLNQSGVYFKMTQHWHKISVMYVAWVFDLLRYMIRI